MSMQASSHALPHAGAHDSHHEELGFWQKYVFSTDHKVIGIQYGITALMFLFFGFLLMLCMRWQIANPGQPIPFIGNFLHSILGDEMVGKDAHGVAGVMMPDLYNSFGAMHGTIMVFLAIVP